MSFRGIAFDDLWREVRRLVRNWLLQTRNARAVFRKADIRIGGGSFTGYPDVLWAQGWMWNLGFPSDPWTFGTPLRPGVMGLWPHNSQAFAAIPAQVPGQYAYTDLRGVHMARAIVNIEAGNGRPTLVWVPVYSSKLAPLATGVNDTGSYADWHTPDGRTLLEWDNDIGPLGARAFGWPPLGACHPMDTVGASAAVRASIRGCHSGHWAQPPREALGTDDVVVAVALMVNATQTELDLGTYTYGVRTWVQLQSVAAETDAWRTYYEGLGQIDEA